MKASTVAFALGVELTTGSVSAIENPDSGALAPAGSEMRAGSSGADSSGDARIRAEAGLLLLPDLGPALGIGVRLGGAFWIEAEGWLVASRLNDDYAPPAMGFGPRLSYRALYPSWELRGSLSVQMLQDDRQYVRRKDVNVDEVRDYLFPALAPGLGAGYRCGPVTLGLDAELVVSVTEYFEYTLFAEDVGGRGLTSRGTTLKGFPRFALYAGYIF